MIHRNTNHKSIFQCPFQLPTDSKQFSRNCQELWFGWHLPGTCLSAYCSSSILATPCTQHGYQMLSAHLRAIAKQSILQGDITMCNASDVKCSYCLDQRDDDRVNLWPSVAGLAYHHHPGITHRFSLIPKYPEISQNCKRSLIISMELNGNERTLDTLWQSKDMTTVKSLRTYQ